MSADAAPISIAGVVLSQPDSSTTPSIGSPRIISSTSIDIRFRQNIDVGERKNSPSEIVGNSSGKPPAVITPRLTCSARSLKCALQCVASDHELAMPITGRPENDSSDQPWFFNPARCKKPSRSLEPNHSAERRILPSVRSVSSKMSPLKYRKKSREAASLANNRVLFCQQF